MTTVFERVQAILVGKLGIDEENVCMDSSLVDDFGADSLDFVELAMTFEEKFSTDHNKIEIVEDDYPALATVGGIVEWLKERHVEDE